MPESRYEKYVIRKPAILVRDGEIYVDKVPETDELPVWSDKDTGPRVIFSNDFISGGIPPIFQFACRENCSFISGRVKNTKCAIRRATAIKRKPPNRIDITRPTGAIFKPYAFNLNIRCPLI